MCAAPGRRCARSGCPLRTASPCAPSPTSPAAWSCTLGAGRALGGRVKPAAAAGVQRAQSLLWAVGCSHLPLFPPSHPTQHVHPHPAEPGHAGAAGQVAAHVQPPAGARARLLWIVESGHTEAPAHIAGHSSHVWGAPVCHLGSLSPPPSPTTAAPVAPPRRSSAHMHRRSWATAPLCAACRRWRCTTRPPGSLWCTRPRWRASSGGPAAWARPPPT